MVPPDKATLRKSMRERRDALLPNLRKSASERIATHVCAFRAPRPASRWALFASRGSEVSTSPLARALLAAGARICYPRVVNAELEFADVAHEGELLPGAFGIREPRGPGCALGEIETMVVPGLAFDRQGGRLGYGGGYYDRVLQAFGGHVVAVAFSAQVLALVPMAEHDRRVPVLITEDGPVGGAAWP